jgi:DNA-binding transcriptional LysR family regulator
MRRRLLPSLSALRAFEAVARHESFTQAASELNVTQSAASRQVRALEDFLGLPMFKRTSRRIELTTEGRFYADLIKEALDRIEAGTGELIATRKGIGTLSIGVLPTFGMRWLIPRLGGFQSRHPEILLNVVSSDGPLDFAAQKVDVAVRFGTGSWPDAIAEPLMSEEIVVACSPVLVEQQKDSDTLDWLARQSLLQHTTRPDSWDHWFRSVGFDERKITWGPSFEHFFMLSRAAQTGLGVALVPRFLIEEELARGVLVAPLPFRVAGPGAYYAVTPKAKQDMARVKLFRNWLQEEAAKLPDAARPATDEA